MRPARRGSLFAQPPAHHHPAQHHPAALSSARKPRSSRPTVRNASTKRFSPTPAQHDKAQSGDGKPTARDTASVLDVLRARRLRSVQVLRVVELAVEGRARGVAWTQGLMNFAGRDKPVVAFVGAPQCGKSSLINALVGHALLPTNNARLASRLCRLSYAAGEAQHVRVHRPSHGALHDDVEVARVACDFSANPAAVAELLRGDRFLGQPRTASSQWACCHVTIAIDCALLKHLDVVELPSVLSPTDTPTAHTIAELLTTHLAHAVLVSACPTFADAARAYEQLVRATGGVGTPPQGRAVRHARLVAPRFLRVLTKQDSVVRSEGEGEAVGGRGVVGTTKQCAEAVGLRERACQALAWEAAARADAQRSPGPWEVPHRPPPLPLSGGEDDDVAREWLRGLLPPTNKPQAFASPFAIAYALDTTPPSPHALELASRLQGVVEGFVQAEELRHANAFDARVFEAVERMVMLVSPCRAYSARRELQGVARCVRGLETALEADLAAMSRALLAHQLADECVVDEVLDLAEEADVGLFEGRGAGRNVQAAARALLEEHVAPHVARLVTTPAECQLRTRFARRRRDRVSALAASDPAFQAFVLAAQGDEARGTAGTAPKDAAMAAMGGVVVLGFGVQAGLQLAAVGVGAAVVGALLWAIAAHAPWFPLLFVACGGVLVVGGCALAARSARSASGSPPVFTRAWKRAQAQELLHDLRDSQRADDLADHVRGAMLDRPMSVLHSALRRRERGLELEADVAVAGGGGGGGGSVASLAGHARLLLGFVLTSIHVAREDEARAFAPTLLRLGRAVAATSVDGDDAQRGREGADVGGGDGALSVGASVKAGTVLHRQGEGSSSERRVVVHEQRMHDPKARARALAEVLASALTAATTQGEGEGSGAATSVFVGGGDDDSAGEGTSPAAAAAAGAGVGAVGVATTAPGALPGPSGFPFLGVVTEAAMGTPALHVWHVRRDHRDHRDHHEDRDALDALGGLVGGALQELDAVLRGDHPPNAAAHVRQSVTDVVRNLAGAVAANSELHPAAVCISTAPPDRTLAQYVGALDKPLDLLHALHLARGCAACLCHRHQSGLGPYNAFALENVVVTPQAGSAGRAPFPQVRLYLASFPPSLPAPSAGDSDNGGGGGGARHSSPDLPDAAKRSGSPLSADVFAFGVGLARLVVAAVGAGPGVGTALPDGAEAVERWFAMGDRSKVPRALDRLLERLLSPQEPGGGGDGGDRAEEDEAGSAAATCFPRDLLSAQAALNECMFELGEGKELGDRCFVCLSSTRSVVLENCGHCCTCLPCTLELCVAVPSKCPVCRQSVGRYIVVPGSAQAAQVAHHQQHKRDSPNNGAGAAAAAAASAQCVVPPVWVPVGEVERLAKAERGEASIVNFAHTVVAYSHAGARKARRLWEQRPLRVLRRLPGLVLAAALPSAAEDAQSLV